VTADLLPVEIWGDLVCPWCYLGKARFERALAAFPHPDRVRVTHRSFELAPDLPRTQVSSVLDMLTAKYGLSAAQAADAEARVGRLAEAEGLPFEIDRQYGNTLDAHRLLHLADAHGRRPELLTALYRAYFSGVPSLFQPDALVDLAVSVGLDGDRAREVLAGEEFTDAVRADERRAAGYGVQGVPFVVVGGTHAVSGAQPVAAFAQALSEAWRVARESADEPDGESGGAGG
jgi:predicted DsbA family dithiol-disulfide isomerase